MNFRRREVVLSVISQHPMSSEIEDNCVFWVNSAIVKEIYNGIVQSCIFDSTSNQFIGRWNLVVKLN